MSRVWWGRQEAEEGRLRPAWCAQGRSLRPLYCREFEFQASLELSGILTLIEYRMRSLLSLKKKKKKLNKQISGII